MLTVWGRANSSNVQKVMWAIAEMGLAHERIDLGGPFGGLDTPEFRARNPNGLIPVIEDPEFEDGGLVIWESHAIVRYLAGRHGQDGLWPADPGTCALADQWMDWFQTTLNPAFGPVFAGLVWTPPSRQDPAAIAAAAARTGKVLEILEARLAETPYVAGPDLTMGDIPYGPTLYRYFTLEIARPGLPNLEAYYRRLQERPAYRAHSMVSYESLRAKD